MQSKRRHHHQQQQQQQQQVPSSASAAPHHHQHPHQHHLQPVQDEDLRRLHLPPSIAVSRDGEEGAAVYNLRLQQSNADAKPDCYQAPPNRTLFPADPLLGAPAAPAGTPAGASVASGPAVLSHHSTSTPSLKLIGAATSPTQLFFLDASKFRSTKHQQHQQPHHHQQQQGRMLPQPTRLADPHRPPGGPAAGAVVVVGDYVSGSLLSSWRATSPDRWELAVAKKKSSIPAGGGGSLAIGGGGLPWPSYPAAAAAGRPAGSTPLGEEAVEDDPTGKRPALTKQRSSSADSVRRLVAKCSLLRFARKQTTTKTPKPSTSGVPLAIDRKQFDEDQTTATTATPGVAKDEEAVAPPWELPPNYVDMIFTKDPPATINPADKKRQRYQATTTTTTPREATETTAATLLL